MNKSKSVRGVPIYNKQNEKCDFCIMPTNKKDRFPVCISPVNLYLYFSNNRWIIKCSDDYKKCKYYKTNMLPKYQRDIKIFGKYIDKFVSVKYKNVIVLTIKHKHWLFNKLVKPHDNYIRALCRFYGYELLIDIEVIKMIVIKKLDERLQNKKASELKKQEFIKKYVDKFLVNFYHGKFVLYRKMV